MSGKPRIWCVGNALLGDDAVGCRVAELLLERGISGVVNCGTTPENYVATLRKDPPSKLWIVDAADMGLQPGQWRKLSLDAWSAAMDSTHGVPLSLLLAPFSESISITVLGIQPATLQLGAPLSEAVEKTARHLADEIARTARLPDTTNRIF